MRVILSEAKEPYLRAWLLLFVSGYTEEDILQRGLVEEGRPFLAKPFTPDEIAAKVGVVLEGAPGGSAG